MARRRSSLGLFGVFGRSSDLRQLDQALDALDVHPRLVPEAIKLTAVNLLKDHAISNEPAPQACRAAAEIIAYCMIGAEAFAHANGADLTLQTERRIEAAIGSGVNLDAQLVLLTIHAGVIQPSVVEQFQLESAEFHRSPLTPRCTNGGT
jgi:hypothetical protein